MPTITQRKDGRYQIRERNVPNDQGKLVTKYFYADTPKEVEALHKAWVKDSGRKEAEAKHVQMHGLSAESDITTLYGWFGRWLDVYGSNSYSMRYAQSGIITKLKESIEDQPLTAIKKSDIQLFANGLTELSFSAVQKAKIVVSKIFGDAHADRLIAFNPCNGVKWAYASKGTHRCLSDQERTLIASNWSFHRSGTWAMLMLFAGLRRGEALALKWGDVDLDNNFIHVSRAIHFESNQAVLGDSTKTIAGVRDIPILSPLLPVLSPKRGKDDEFICQAANSQEMTAMAFRKGWNSYMTSLSNILNGEKPIQQGRRSDKPKYDDYGNVIIRKIFTCKTHDLRHTFCTMLFEADVDLKTAQQLMGHADADMTLKVYTHLSESKKKTSYEKLISYAERWNFDTI